MFTCKHREPRRHPLSRVARKTREGEPLQIKFIDEPLFSQTRQNPRQGVEGVPLKTSLISINSTLFDTFTSTQDNI